jgi:hypothetical protein
MPVRITHLRTDVTENVIKYNWNITHLEICLDYVLTRIYSECVCVFADLTRNTKLSYCQTYARYPQLLQIRASSVVDISNCTQNSHSKYIF